MDKICATTTMRRAPEKAPPLRCHRIQHSNGVLETTYVLGAMTNCLYSIQHLRCRAADTCLSVCFSLAFTIKSIVADTTVAWTGVRRSIVFCPSAYTNLPFFCMFLGRCRGSSTCHEWRFRSSVAVDNDVIRAARMTSELSHTRIATAKDGADFVGCGRFDKNELTV